MKAEVIEIMKLEGIPSASAMAKVGDQLMVVGDDSPWVFMVDKNGKETQRTRLFEGEGPRIPKPDKADLECMVALGNEDGFMMFGSGSKLPKRAQIVYWPFGSEPEVIPALDFYNGMIKACAIPPESLNLEGAACKGWELYLFNRGGNHVISLNAAELLKHLKQGGAVPEMKVQQMQLPSEAGHPAGFSGASMLGNHQILFCASIEATTDWINDGEVLRSFVGVMDLGGSLKDLRYTAIMYQGQKFKGKVEAIELKRWINKRKFEAWAVTDDDAGGSELLVIEVLLED